MSFGCQMFLLGGKIKIHTSLPDVLQDARLITWNGERHGVLWVTATSPAGYSRHAGAGNSPQVITHQLRFAGTRCKLAALQLSHCLCYCSRRRWGTIYFILGFAEANAPHFSHTSTYRDTEPERCVQPLRTTVAHRAPERSNSRLEKQPFFPPGF